MTFENNECDKDFGNEIYDTTDWDERKLIRFINYTINRKAGILENYLLLIVTLLLVILLKVW